MMIKKRAWVFCSVAMLLVVLAALQYRWIAEASRAEQERLNQNLFLATNRIAQDFESQFFHLGFAGRVIQPGAKLLEGDFEADSAARLGRHYAEWMASSPYPGLLQD